MFTYIYPFLYKANKNGVNINILPHLNEQNEIQHTFKKISKQIEIRRPIGKHGLVNILAQVFKKQFFAIFFLVLLVSAIKMYSPFLCAQIISFVQQRQTRSLWQGIVFLAISIIIILLKSVIESQMNYRLSILGINLSLNLSLMIYDKSLKYPILREKQFSSSTIINYSQVDCQRMAYFGNQLCSLLLAPLQLIIGIIIMWSFIGIAFLSGLATTLLMVGITFFISKFTIKLNSQVLKAKDSRMKATQQMLQNIRYIKINALQDVISQKVNRSRQKELLIYKKKGWFEALGYFVYWLTGPMILFSTFITYVLLGNDMTSQAAFTTIIIFTILQYPIRQLPTSISQLFQILASLKRIELFLSAKEINNHNFIFNQLPYEQSSIKIQSGNFLWKIQKQQSKQTKYEKILKNINLQFKRNKLTMIVGRVGSGKSSLFLAILNQMKCKKNTKVIVNGKLSYCNQNPWIISNTIRMNIILFNQYNQYRFQKAVYYSGLTKDLQIFPQGDQTEIGQKGMNISGGQKARISLARALYKNSDIYLFDDILSSVDVSIADFLVKETIREYLKNKTVILVTNHLKYAKLADKIVLIKKGKIILNGKSQNVISSKDFKELFSLQNQHLFMKPQQNLNQQFKLMKFAIESKQKQALIQSNVKLIQQLMIPQQNKLGQIKWQVFRQYIILNGGFLQFGLIVLLAMLLWIVSTTFASIFMSMWCSNPKQYSNGLIIYTVLSLSSSLFILIRASVLILSGVKQGQKIHRLMINSLLKASLTKFYNRVPIGRIINRLTRDLRELDEAIGPAIGGLLVCFFQMLGTIAICVYSSTLYLLIPIVIMGYCCWKVKTYYLNVQRQVVRLQKTTSTPIINGFVSTLRGLQSVRAYKLQPQLLNQQINCMNENKRVRETKQGLESWFALNLTYLSLIVNAIAIAYCILNQSTNASVAGLLITYALNLSTDVNLAILCYAYFETKVISLERIYEFTQIEPQEQFDRQYSNAAIQGKISFVDVSIRYRQDLPNILQNITLTIRSGEKIGVAGRSGSGKSSIINALLRIAFISKGHLFIDGVSIDNIPLDKLRKQITVIDQEPIIISGSFRDNIDIYGRFTDNQIIQVLKQCEIYENIQLKGGLKSNISKESLSSGQKQIICICRALLRQNKIVLIDEATASIDEKSDQIIQKIIKYKFKSSTVITIAHRLQTLSSSDKILILEQGSTAEFGAPSDLLKKQGIYYEMVKLNSINI